MSPARGLDRVVQRRSARRAAPAPPSCPLAAPLALLGERVLEARAGRRARRTRPPARRSGRSGSRTCRGAGTRRRRAGPARRAAGPPAGARRPAPADGQRDRAPPRAGPCPRRASAPNWRLLARRSRRGSRPAARRGAGTRRAIVSMTTVGGLGQERLAPARAAGRGGRRGGGSGAGRSRGPRSTAARRRRRGTSRPASGRR